MARNIPLKCCALMWENVNLFHGFSNRVSTPLGRGKKRNEERLSHREKEKLAYFFSGLTKISR